MSSDFYTILGASGFIGGYLATHLKAQGQTIVTPPRGAELVGQTLGHVIYAIGLTADFRTRPYDTIEAHICRLTQILRNNYFDSFLYLSSTRVYGWFDTPRSAAQTSASETDLIQINPTNPDALYALSKLTAEALCMTHAQQTVRVVRLSNIYGVGMSSDSFLAAVINAAKKGHVQLASTLESSKDYLSITDTADALLRIIHQGEERLYNVACGHNVAIVALITELKHYTGCKVEITPQSPCRCFAPIALNRLQRLYQNTDKGWEPSMLVEKLAELVPKLSS